MPIHKPQRILDLLRGLENDRQLKNDSTLKMKIKRLLEAQLKTHDRPNRNPFAGPAPVKHHHPDPMPKPETTETPIEQIRRKNRYIK